MMGERMRDMGRAAMAAAALNGGLGAEAKAEAPHEEPKIVDTRYYVNADEASQEIFRKVDAGEYRFETDTTPAPVVYSSEVLDALKAQDLYVVDGHKILTSRELSAGDGMDWNVITVDKSGHEIMETTSVVMKVDGKAVVVTLLNSDASIDVARFENGKIASCQHMVPMTTPEHK